MYYEEVLEKITPILGVEITERITVATSTDWIMLTVALMGVVATVVTVFLTNRQTRKIYEETRTSESKNQALSLVKPILKNTAIWELREKLILDGNEERMLMLTSKKEGFDFYDNNSRSSEHHFILSVSNDGVERIEHIHFNISVILVTVSQAEIPHSFTNVVKLLRNDERALLRLYSDEQQQKLSSSLENGDAVTTKLIVTVNYITTANEQICYSYDVVITETPKKDEQDKVRVTRKTEIIKDQYERIAVPTLDTTAQASPFRDLQENLTSDGFGYRYRKIGDQQMTGTLDALHRFWKEKGMDDMMSSVVNTVDEMGKSMSDVAQAVNSQKELFETLMSKQSDPQQIGVNNDGMEVLEDEN